MEKAALSAPSNLKNMTVGMTDDELEQACEDQNPGIAPWAYWTSELYSLGKCLRFWTKYPKFLPLYVYSDHGVGAETTLFPHDLENPAKVHFTWNPLKEQKYKDFIGKKVIQIINPWISYRRMRGIQRSAKPRGTLVFFTHSTPAVQWVGHDSEEYFVKLKELSEKFQPVVICLHMHDIRAGLHKKLRSFGFPLVTAGNTASVNFVDSFYSIIRNYAYATSNLWGSQVFYCVEMGIPYFFLGERPELMNISDKNLSDGMQKKYWDQDHEKYEKKADELFKSPVDVVTDEQRTIIEFQLGFNSRLSRWQVSWILWREFFRNWRQLNVVFKAILVTFLGKLGLLRMIKRIRIHFKSN
ncbi:MAG: hypothetical protein OEV66_02595 [Spirochaetia bacterium]|nr:hypothetical protein [Spirochaetia bacterium]